jgi:hypothetical protein
MNVRSNGTLVVPLSKKHGGLGGAIWGIIFMQWVGLMASFTLTTWSAMTQFVELELFPNQCLSR